MDALTTYQSPMSGSHTIFFARAARATCLYCTSQLLGLHVPRSKAARTMFQVSSYHIVRVPLITCRHCTCYLSGLHLIYVRASRTIRVMTASTTYPCIMYHAPKRVRAARTLYHGCSYHSSGSYPARIRAACTTCTKYMNLVSNFV